ncbi:conserved Plasmodium protein, unknown function [Plasmodium sp. gorilla clade G2]|uniref:conserved Plasmodium protein, unknown function n=1 Tax=Plasmodium sp. gorilla clade G2 TaxID=880535 RepID=UPI000D225A7A|nr:conserved Plasmodium protein, unknown function [Plasmodium sp. gorilla clade G2]SOV12450.1 conserved Plasmodium protein, unknown function [Plasmodium sp. gorilla clade G2]
MEDSSELNKSIEENEDLESDVNEENQNEENESEENESEVNESEENESEENKNEENVNEENNNKDNMNMYQENGNYNNNNNNNNNDILKNSFHSNMNELKNNINYNNINNINNNINNNVGTKYLQEKGDNSQYKMNPEDLVNDNKKYSNEKYGEMNNHSKNNFKNRNEHMMIDEQKNSSKHEKNRYDNNLVFQPSDEKNRNLFQGHNKKFTFPSLSPTDVLIPGKEHENITMYHFNPEKFGYKYNNGLKPSEGYLLIYPHISHNSIAPKIKKKKMRCC